MQNVRQEQTGVATGMNTVMRTLGGAVGGQIVASFLAGNLAADGLPSDSSFTLAFTVCAGALFIAIAVGSLIPGRRREAAAPGLVPATSGSSG